MKKAIKRLLADIMYFLYSKNIFRNKIKVQSIDKTLDELIHSEKSMVRFGDGEVVIIKGADLLLQKSSPEIVAKMKQLLQYEYENLIVTIPDIFDGLEQYQNLSKVFWKDHLLFCRKLYYRYCTTDKEYGHSFVSRCYYQFQDKSSCEVWFAKIKKIWENKEVIIVEGTATHNGVGNDLFDLATSVGRIICPPKNAMDVYEKILAACKEYSKDKLFVVSLGVTAKFLAEDLYNAGYRVLDMGHVDMEYEWFLRKAEGKIPLEKHQILGEQANKEAGYLLYLKQVEKIIEG